MQQKSHPLLNLVRFKMWGGKKAKKNIYCSAFHNSLLTYRKHLAMAFFNQKKEHCTKHKMLCVKPPSKAYCRFMVLFIHNQVPLKSPGSAGEKKNLRSLGPESPLSEGCCLRKQGSRIEFPRLTPQRWAASQVSLKNIFSITQVHVPCMWPRNDTDHL